MCRTSGCLLLQTVMCIMQMLLRIVLTITMMVENLVRMLLHTVYNIISIILQTISLLPICCVFLLTSRCKSLFCGGGSCGIARQGRCDCLLSLLAFFGLIFLLRATGILDSILNYFGYTKSKAKVLRFQSSTDTDAFVTEQLAKMCRTVHAVLQTIICGIQMLVRVFMTIILMIENVIRMILQTLYNFISFMLQMISLIPICIVFLLTARLKCFMCGGGGACPVARGGACDCLMSLLAVIILFFIFRATGVLDKIFFSLGYTKYRPQATRFIPTPGDITECSRNDTEPTTDLSTQPDTTMLYTDETEMQSDETEFVTGFLSTTEKPDWTTFALRALISASKPPATGTSLPPPPTIPFPWGGSFPPPGPLAQRRQNKPVTPMKSKSKSTKWTTVVYYLL